MKLIILTAAFALTLTTINAQGFYFGPTGGYGVSMLNLDEKIENPENKPHSSYNAGLRFLYSSGGSWGISTDVKFSKEGGRLQTRPGAGDIWTSDYDVHYVRVPIQAIYYFGQPASSIRPKISAGPSIGFQVGGKSEFKLNGTHSNTEDSERSFEQMDIGANVALGLDFKVGTRTRLNTDINYYHGFPDVYEPEVYKRENRGLTFNVALLFPLSK